MKRILLIAAAALSLSACMMTDDKDATRVLNDAGYSEIQITGYQWTGCAKDDNIHTGFVAKGPRGAKVSGVVCSSWGPFGKSNTIRLN